MSTLSTLQEEWPASLKEFVCRCTRLSLCRDPPPHVMSGAVPLEREVAKRMTPKKRHEVCKGRMKGVGVWYA